MKYAIWIKTDALSGNIGYGHECLLKRIDPSGVWPAGIVFAAFQLTNCVIFVGSGSESETVKGVIRNNYQRR